MIFSLILRTAARLLVPLLLLFSLFMLLRGHNAPGGGFVGGLVAASGFVLYAFARGSEEAGRVLRAAPRMLLAVGLSCTLGSGLLALALGEAFLKSLWLDLYLPFGITYHAGTTLLFDVGVFLVVIGTVLLMVFAVEEQGAVQTDRL